VKLIRKRGSKHTYMLPCKWLVTPIVVIRKSMSGRRSEATAYSSPTGKTWFVVHVLNCSAF